MRAGPTGPWAFHPDDVKVKVKVILFGSHCMIIILLFELQMQADSPYNFFVHG